MDIHTENRDNIIGKDKNDLFEEYRKAKNRWLFINAWDNAKQKDNYNKQYWRDLHTALLMIGLIDN